jgi:erythromycin esterase
MRWMLVTLVACQAASPVANPIPPRGGGPDPRDPRVTIAGRVVAPDRTPVAGAVVALISPAGLEHHTSSDATGAFRFRVRAGTAWGISAHASRFTGAFIDAIEPARPVELTLAASGGRDAVTIRLPVKSPEALPPNAAVALSRKSTNNADLWAVPVDIATATATITVPRASQYFAQGLDALVGDVEFVDPARPPALAVTVQQPPPASVLAYVREHAIPLATVEAGNGFADLARFGTLVGDATVVAIGEATHGTREYFQLKHRLFEYLATEKQFTTFAFEADQAECRAIDGYVQGGPGDARTLVRALDLWVWRTEEVVALVEWMRAYNADPARAAASAKLHFVGFDMQSWAPAFTNVQRFLARLDPRARTALDAAAAPLAASPADSLRIFWALPDDQKTTLATALVAAQRAVEAHPRDAGFGAAHADVRSLAQWVAYYRTNQDTVRDRFLADNILAIHARAPSVKMMIWAHNYHAGRYSFVPSMGTHLQKTLGSAYLPIGIVFGGGRFLAAGALADGSHSPVDTHAFGPPTPFDVAVPFVASGHAQLALDLRAVPAGPVKAWFFAPHLVRELGWLYTSDFADTRLRILPEHFDAVLFVARSTPARRL